MKKLKITIGGHEVHVIDDTVKIGCQTATFKQVLKVGNMLRDVDFRKVGGERVNELSAKHDGMWFTAKIDGVRMVGRISVQPTAFFMCQNQRSGLSCNNRMGFDSSWTVGPGTDLGKYDVREVKVYESIPGVRKRRVYDADGVYPNHVMYNGFYVSNADVRKLAAAVRREMSKGNNKKK